MKEAWKIEIDRFEELHKRKVKKGDFVEVFGKAFVTTFSEDTILAAFKAMGIFPFNPDVITEQQMKLSQATSTQASFPLAQPTPVRRVMAVCHDQPHTAFDITADIPSSPQAGGSVSVPQTPLHTVPSSIDPDLFTPTKHGCILVGALGSSASAPFLVGTSKLTSSQTIAEPVLEGQPNVPKPDWNLIPSTSDNVRGHPFPTPHMQLQSWLCNSDSAPTTPIVAAQLRLHRHNSLRLPSPRHQPHCTHLPTYCTVLSHTWTWLAYIVVTPSRVFLKVFSLDFPC
jgi:hypothetical protein